MENNTTMRNTVDAFIESYESLINMTFKEYFDVSKMSEASEEDLRIFNKCIGIMVNTKNMLTVCADIIDHQQEIIDRINERTRETSAKVDLLINRSAKKPRGTESNEASDFREVYDKVMDNENK